MDESQPATRALMACLGDPSRFRLVQALIDGARCVTDLAAEVGLSQSCTTRHLQALERRNIVRGTRDGKRVLYRVRDDRADLMPLIGWALETYSLAGAGLDHRPPLVVTSARGKVARAGQPRGREKGSSAPTAASSPITLGPAPGANASPAGSEAAEVQPHGIGQEPPARDLRESHRRQSAELEDYLL